MYGDCSQVFVYHCDLGHKPIRLHMTYLTGILAENCNDAQNLATVTIHTMACEIRSQQP